MDKYELIVIVDSTIAQEEKESVIKSTTETISKLDAKVINSQVWLDKHRFAFKIKKSLEGTYYLINFEGVTSAIAKIRQALRLNEKILRSLIVRAE
jgi:ribosomal protein S6